jgi:hypothetical protein
MSIQLFDLAGRTAAMLWGHYWDASNCMTIPTVVAKLDYRGTASGFAYMFVKLPSFLAIFLFPALFAAIGQANATLFVAIFPLIGLLAAIFILPEIYGFDTIETDPLDRAPASQGFVPPCKRPAAFVVQGFRETRRGGAAGVSSAWRPAGTAD